MAEALISPSIQEIYNKLIHHGNMNCIREDTISRMQGDINALGTAMEALLLNLGAKKNG